MWTENLRAKLCVGCNIVVDVDADASLQPRGRGLEALRNAIVEARAISHVLAGERDVEVVARRFW